MTAPRLVVPAGGRVAGAAAAGLVAGAVALRRQSALTRSRYGTPAEAPGPVDVVVEPLGRPRHDGRPWILVGVGDSGMAGVGVDAIVDTLPVQLGQHLADSTGRAVRVVCIARSGARTADVLAEQVAQVPADVDVIVLMVGTNDVMHLTPRRRLARDTGALLDALVATGAPVVLSSLPEVRVLRAVPRPLRDAALLAAAGVQRVQQQAAHRRPRVDLVDVRRAAGPLFLQRPEALSADLFHPSASGYRLIADALLPAVQRALAEPGDANLSPACAPLPQTNASSRCLPERAASIGPLKWMRMRMLSTAAKKHQTDTKVLAEIS